MNERTFRCATIEFLIICHPERSVRNPSTRILCGWADAQSRDLLLYCPNR